MNPDSTNFSYTPSSEQTMQYIPVNPPPVQPPPPNIPDPGSPFGKFLPLLIGFFIVVAIIGGTVLTLSQLQKQQEVRSRASEVSVQWYTSQSVTTACVPEGVAVITAKFTNTETSAGKAMKVSVKDNQTGKTVDLGIVGIQQTKTGVINSGKTQLNSGNVTFNLSWANGDTGTDRRTASYPAVGPCPGPTPTSMVTITPTTVYGVTPTTKVTVTPTPKYPPTATPKPTVTPTPKYPPTSTPKVSPTPTTCPTPGTVRNIKIICPHCPPTENSGA